jgi:hypothetical protein
MRKVCVSAGVGDIPQRGGINVALIAGTGD